MKLEVQIRETLRRQKGTRDEVHRLKKGKRGQSLDPVRGS